MLDTAELLRAPTAAETGKFFQDIDLPDKLEVRQSEALCQCDHGKRLFVREGSRFSKGEVILRESARLSVQHSTSRAESLCCARCFKYLDSIPAQILHQLQGAGYAVSKLDLNHEVLDRCDTLAAPVACRDGCGTVYCSEQCERSAWLDQHALLCTGKATESQQQAIEAFREMCDEVNDHLWLAGGCLHCMTTACILPAQPL